MEGGSGVQRRVRDQAARQRRGSIKSRIVQFSKVSSTVQYSTAQHSTLHYSTVQYQGTVLYIFWWVATILGTDRASRARELSELKFKLPLTAAVSGLSPLLSPGHCTASQLCTFIRSLKPLVVSENMRM